MLDFFSSETGIVVIDDFLTPEALEELLAFTEESTIWHDDGPGEYGTDRRGYLGAYLNDGFGSGLLMQVSQCQAVPCMHTDARTCNTSSPAPQIAAELKQRLPDIFHNHSLHQAWAYKYNSTKVGVTAQHTANVTQPLHPPHLLTWTTCGVLQSGINAHADEAAVRQHRCACAVPRASINVTLTMPMHAR